MDNFAFEIIRGDDATITVRVLDDSNEPIDLTDYSIFFTAKKSAYDSDNDSVLSKEVPGDADGEVEVNFTAIETGSLKPRSYWWDIQLEKEGIVTSTRRQLFRVTGDITRRTNEDVS